MPAIVGQNPFTTAAHEPSEAGYSGAHGQIDGGDGPRMSCFVYSNVVLGECM